jgi:hypothetical protein
VEVLSFDKNLIASHDVCLRINELENNIGFKESRGPGFEGPRVQGKSN